VSPTTRRLARIRPCRLLARVRRLPSQIINSAQPPVCFLCAALFQTSSLLRQLPLAWPRPCLPRRPPLSIARRSPPTHAPPKPNATRLRKYSALVRFVDRPTLQREYFEAGKLPQDLQV
jgi:hypothetical protein